MIQFDLALLISPLITAALAAIGVYVAIVSRLTTTETLIAELRKSVDKHNSVVERTYKLESDQKTTWIRIDELRNDILELRKEVKNNG